jgi:hypothetical protein
MGKNSKKPQRLEVAIRADLHRKISHLSVDTNRTIQETTDSLIEIGLSYQQKVYKTYESDKKVPKV